MKYILILSLILTMGDVVGSAIDTITLGPKATDGVTAEKAFLFKLKVNDNMVLLNTRAAVFEVRCNSDSDTTKIFELVKANLISTFGLNVNKIENMSFSFIKAEETNITKHLRAPNEIVSMVCIPTCELSTTDYPEKEHVENKYLYWSAFFLTKGSDGKLELHQRF